MTIIVTRNTPERFGGFLASCMLEIAPGTYLSPNLTRSVAQRIWDVLEGWGELLPENGGVLMLWNNRVAPSGIEIKTLGWGKKEMFDYEGVWFSIDKLTGENNLEELKKLLSEDIC